MNAGALSSNSLCHALVKFLDAVQYKDNNLTFDERVERLRYVHSGTRAYFAQESTAATSGAWFEPRKLASALSTICRFVVYCFSKIPKDAQVDVSIYFTIILICDDETNSDPSSQMASFWINLAQGKKQAHPFWALIITHLPALLSHYQSFCAFNIMRGTIDFFQACWVEQHELQGYESKQYAIFLRRLGSLGAAAGGALFPAVEFKEQEIFEDIVSVMAHIDNPVAYVNDLFSLYKEFENDEANLVSNWCTFDGMNLEQALERLTDEATQCCLKILSICKDKDERILDAVRGYIHGCITWHFCDSRYRLSEIYDRADGVTGERFRVYYEKALSIGGIDL